MFPSNQPNSAGALKYIHVHPSKADNVHEGRRDIVREVVNLSLILAYLYLLRSTLSQRSQSEENKPPTFKLCIEHLILWCLAHLDEFLNEDP
jgi:hypothetical protein